MLLRCLPLAAAAGARSAGLAVAQDIKLPPPMSFTAHGTGISGFNITAAFAEGWREARTDALREAGMGVACE